MSKRAPATEGQGEEGRVRCVPKVRKKEGREVGRSERRRGGGEVGGAGGADGGGGGGGGSTGVERGW